MIGCVSGLVVRHFSRDRDPFGIKEYKKSETSFGTSGPLNQRQSATIEET
jgi:hypothetical protein